MIGTRLGPYLLQKELGTGGMGSVFLATAMEDAAGLKEGARVAIKVVHPHLIEQRGFFKRFLREAEIGRQVRHENVVRTIDVDAAFHDGRQVNFLVMEHVDGRSLRVLVEEMGTVPEALLREVALQVAGGLEAIHAAGVVHRDLKPENLLITGDQSVRIMDLGVAHLQEASVALTREGQFAGSFPYAAPEQFHGGQVGAASDLYSLGVLFYELATGVNPFARDTPAAVIQAHLNLEPERASDRNEEISPFLAEVLSVLMAKDPVDRFATAAELRSVLDEGESSAWWAAREAEVRKSARALPRIPVSRETPLVGREKEMEALREAFERARAGKGRTFLLEGDAGIGRTRLVDAFLQGLGGTDVHALYGSYPPSGGLGGISEAVIGKLGSAGLDEALRPYLTVTPSLVPAFAAMLRHEQPPAGSEPLSGDAIHAVFVHLVRALAKEKPVVWVVEDLHFAPAESRKILLSLARAVDGHRVLLLLTTRPGLPEEEIGHLSRLGNFGRAALGRLSPREVIEVLREALRSTALAERLGGKIAYKSDGVPYFVFEILRGLKEGKFLGQRADGTYFETKVVSDIEVPSAVKDLVLSRLRDLAKEERALVDVGAVEGFAFSPDLVARVLEEKKVRVLQDLAEVERRTGLIHSEGRTYRFDGHQVHDVIHDDLSVDLREEYHSMLAEAFADREGVEGAKPEEVAGEAAVFMAFHHFRGSRRRDGAPWILPAVKHLRESLRDEEAIDLLDRALDRASGLPDDLRLRTLLKATPLRLDLGMLALARTEGEEAVALAERLEDPPLRAKAIRSLGSVLSRTGDIPGAEARFLEACALAEQAGIKEELCRAEGGLGHLFYRFGDYARARAHHERQGELAREIGNASLELEANAGLGPVLGDLGLHSVAREHQERALSLARSLKDRRSERQLIGNIGERDRAEGRFGSALERYAMSIAVAREFGFRSGEAIQVHNLGETLSALGDATKALENLEDSRRLGVETGLHFLRHYNARARADISLQRGDAREARALYEQALEGARADSLKPIEAEALVGLGRLHALEGASAEAMASLNSAIDVARAIGSPNELSLATAIRATLSGGDAVRATGVLDELGRRPWHTARMESCWWLWKATGDGAHLGEANRLLDHLVANAPEECRGPMMERVPLHREIAAAAREAGL